MYEGILQSAVGILVVIYVILAFSLDFLRKRCITLNTRLSRFSLDARVPDRFKMWFMGGMGVFGLALYIYCTYCKFKVVEIGECSDFVPGMVYFVKIFEEVMGILPWFICGCIIAGLVIKYYTSGKLRLPQSMIASGAFASVLPICSCAAVPMAHGMMLAKRMPVRAIITFLIVVPVLSPVVMVLAVSQIGWTYLITEIVAVFAFAMLTGILIERYAGVKDPENPKGPCVSCEGCKGASLHAHRTSALLSGWDQFFYLLKYILFGIMLGAAIATYVDPSIIADLFGARESFTSSLGGLVLIVLIAIPIFICSGEDVIILAPLLGMGLPLGHAIAFAIAGNAICITAIPVLNATFGKKVTILIFLSFFVGAILLGLIINGAEGWIGAIPL
jgi:uncharacterized membrane protein YraQ (UPF0718 family)